ncbi:MAG: hypothetical protein KGQ59_03945, partial [Bdellovibrionales bacterium]|nr:hypothetical protein [Bdellovibrionales bacterium]
MKTKSLMQIGLVLSTIFTAAHAVAHEAKVPASVVGTSIVTTLPPTMTTVVLAITLDEITTLTSGNRLAAAEVQQIVVESLEDAAIYEAEGQMG